MELLYLERSAKAWKGAGRAGSRSTNRDYSDYRIAKISQNTETSPGDLKRLEETCCHLDSSGRLLANACVKNSQGRK